ISAVTLGETAFREYRDKMIEVVGEAKDHKIIDEVAKDKVASSDGSDIVVIEPGNVLCYDTLTGRFFASTMEKIRKAENDIGRKCINEMYASQNDFYRLLGIPAVAVGEELGWNNDNPMELQFTSLL